MTGGYRGGSTADFHSIPFLSSFKEPERYLRLFTPKIKFSMIITVFHSFVKSDQAEWFEKRLPFSPERKWAAFKGNESVNRGIYLKLPGKRRGKKEGRSCVSFFYPLHLCSPYINTYKTAKELQIWKKNIRFFTFIFTFKLTQ